MPFLDAPAGSSHHLFPVLLADAAARPEFMAHLSQQGVQTSIHYPPVHRFSHYCRLWPEEYDHRLPRTEDAAARLVTLPLFPTMTQTQFDLVVDAARAFFMNS
jgi:dTDP-4-amino-4,6-dideoxygalactose transaminase